LRATIAPGKTPGTVKIDLRVDLSDLMLQESGGKYTAHLRVLVSPRSAGGPEGEPKDSSLDPQLTKEQHDAYLKDGFPIPNEVTIDSSTTSVRLVVGDRVTDWVGSLTIPVAPPK
jgi:hypothetical protein